MNVVSSSQAAILHCMTEVSPYPGISLQINGNYIGLSGQNLRSTLTTVDGSTPVLSSQSTEYQPFIIRKQGTEIDFISKNGKASTTYTHHSTQKSLLIGAYQSDTGYIARYANITVNQAKIWTKAITDEEVQALING